MKEKKEPSDGAEFFDQLSAQQINTQPSISSQEFISKTIEEPTKPTVIRPIPVEPEEKKVVYPTVTSLSNAGLCNAISNKGIMVFTKGNKLIFKKLSVVKEDETVICMEIHDLIFKQQASTNNRKELIDSIDHILMLKIPEVEQLIWKLIRLVILHNSMRFFATTLELSSLRQSVIKMLNEYKGDNKLVEENKGSISLL